MQREFNEEEGAKLTPSTIENSPLPIENSPLPCIFCSWDANEVAGPRIAQRPKENLTTHQDTLVEAPWSDSCDEDELGISGKTFGSDASENYFPNEGHTNENEPKDMGNIAKPARPSETRITSAVPAGFPGDPPGRPPGGRFPGQPPGPPPRRHSSPFPGAPPGPAPRQHSKEADAARTSVVSSSYPPGLIVNEYVVPPGLTGKRLPWVPLLETRIKGSLWERLIPTEFDGNAPGRRVRLTIDYNSIVDLFFENKQTVKQRSEQKQQKTDPTIKLLSAKRRQNIEICLRAQGLLDDISNLINAVAKLEGFSHDTRPCPISLEALEIVLSLLPTPEEERALASHSNISDITQFARAERFLIQLSRISKFRQRAEACLFAMTYPKEIKGLEERLDSLLSGTAALLKVTEPPNGELLPLLALILRLGNLLNNGTRKGHAKGFTVDSLAMLKNLRSADGSTNLLRVVASSLESQSPCCWAKLDGALSLFTSRQDISLEDTAAILLTLQQRVFATVQTASTVDDKKSSREFKILAEEADREVKRVECKMMDCEKALTQLTVLFGEKQKPQEGLVLAAKLGSFWKDLVAARNENAERSARDAKKLKTPRPSDSLVSPPKTPPSSRAASIDFTSTATKVRQMRHQDDGQPAAACKGSIPEEVEAPPHQSRCRNHSRPLIRKKPFEGNTLRNKP